MLDKHQKLVKDWNRVVGQHSRFVAPRPSGRPLAASDAQIADVVKRYKAGASLRAIVANTGQGLRTADYRARKRRRDALPARITETRKRGHELVKAAKGLGKSL